MSRTVTLHSVLLLTVKIRTVYLDGLFLLGHLLGLWDFLPSSVYYLSRTYTLTDVPRFGRCGEVQGII